MSRFATPLLIAFALFQFPAFSQTEPTEKPPKRQNQKKPKKQGKARPKISLEEWQLQQTKIINEKIAQIMEKMGDSITEDNRGPFQTALQEHFVDELKLRVIMQKARVDAKGDREKIRKAMQETRKKREAVSKSTNLEMKELLASPKYLKKFKKNHGRDDSQSRKRAGSKWRVSASSNGKKPRDISIISIDTSLLNKPRLNPSSLRSKATDSPFIAWASISISAKFCRPFDLDSAVERG